MNILEIVLRGEGNKVETRSRLQKLKWGHTRGEVRTSGSADQEDEPRSHLIPSRPRSAVVVTVSGQLIPL